jgi:hypothetical protein
MKMWVSVSSCGEVSSIIKIDDLQIETYTEQLVTMFNAIVSRDAQSPHGKFYFVAKRLQERFAHIKEGAAKDDQTDTNYESGPSSSQGANSSTRQSSANQTPLHLLSEVAMGSSNNPASQQQTPAHSRSQQQAQAALQAHAQHSQQAVQPTWYPNMPPQHTPDLMGLGTQAPFDINFDFTQFDLGTGSDADLSALFIPDSMAIWGYPTDPNMQNYNGF